MKFTLLMAALVLTTTAYSKPILKRVLGNETCLVSHISENTYTVKKMTKVGDIQTSKSLNVTVTNLDKNILRAYENSNSKDKAIKRYDMLFAGYKTIQGDQGTYYTEFDIHPDDSDYAMKLIFILKDICE